MAKAAPKSREIHFYFFDRPGFDPHAVLAALNACDPDDVDPWSLTGAPAEHASALLMGREYLYRTHTFELSLCPQDMPLGAAEMLRSRVIAPQVAAMIPRHMGSVLVRMSGGDDQPPIEHMVVLYKLALALAPAGAFCMGIPALGVARILQEFAELAAHIPKVAAESGNEDLPKTVWALMRATAEPYGLHNGICLMQMEGIRGQWACTHRNAFHGLPDLAIEIKGAVTPQRGVELVSQAHRYLMLRGDVVEPGHTMGETMAVEMHFRAPTDTEAGLSRQHRVLMIEPGPKKKGGFLSRLFGG